MFLYYEKFPCPGDVSKDVYEFVMSSHGQDASINWKDKQEKMYLDVISGIFKEIPLKNRMYDEQTHIWAFVGHYGAVILSHLESMITQGLFTSLTITEVENLEERVKNRTLNQKKRAAPAEAEIKFKEEEFFYTHAASSSSTPSGAALVSKLLPLLSCSEEQLISANDIALKKLYRQAALRLHPDRNSGDGSKMSELNMLWEIYMSKGA